MMTLVLCACGTPEDLQPVSSTPTSSVPEAEYILNITAEAGGVVPIGLNGPYPARETIEIVAHPNPGFSFYRWVVYSDDSEGPWLFKNQNPAQFTIQWNLNIVATFKKASELFHLEIIDGPHGGIPAGGARVYSGNYLEGEVISGLIVRSHEGWVFERWIVYSNDYEIKGTIDRNVSTFIMPPYNVFLVAEYKEMAP
jgi:hypothetical protein